MLGLLALALLAPAARAGDGEATNNLRGAAVHKPPARVVAPVFPYAYARRLDICAFRIVRRRRDVVLRHEGLEHLRLRRPQTQTLQSQEHGRSENSTRGLPGHLQYLLITYPLSQVTRHHKN